MTIDLGLKDKIVLITGGSQGIGRASAELLTDEGARILVCARRREQLEETVVALQSRGGDVFGMTADVSQPEDVSRLFSALDERWGGLDVLINNAGTSKRGNFERLTDEQWQADFDLKLFAAIRAAKLAIPLMRKRGGGRIVNVLNFLAKQPVANSMPTSVSRAAGLAFTKSLSLEFAAENILVNAVCMGYVRASQHEENARRAGVTIERYYDQLATLIPLGRVGSTSEAASVILFLASGLSSYVTGTSINVDGGICAVW